MTPLLLALALAQQPLPPDAVLPPNHPPVGTQAPPAGGQAPGGGQEQGRGAPTTEELMQKLDQAKGLKDKDKPFEVAASMGRLYLSHGRYDDAVTFYEQAVSKADEAKKLYLAKKAAAGKAPIPAPASVGCAPEGQPNLEQQLALAKAKAKAPEAASCARAALHPLAEVENQLAKAKFLSGDKAGALEVHARALELFPSDPEARYGRAAVLLDSKGDDLPSLKLAKADLERFLADYPTSARAPQARQFLSRANDAIAAGGIAKLAAQPAKRAPEPPAAPGALPADHPPIDGRQPTQAAPAAPAAPTGPDRPPQLTPEVMDALSKVQVTDEMKKGFEGTIAGAEAALAAGEFQKALDGYKQVMPFQPDNPRVRAGIAWTLVRLNKPTAANVWNVAIGDPAAVDALGDTLAAKGDKAGAKLLWTRLKESAPAYAPKLEAKLR